MKDIFKYIDGEKERQRELAIMQHDDAIAFRKELGFVVQQIDTAFSALVEGLEARGFTITINKEKLPCYYVALNYENKSVRIWISVYEHKAVMRIGNISKDMNSTHTINVTTFNDFLEQGVKFLISHF